MEQQTTEGKVLDSIERAKLGIKVFSMSFDEAEEVIDEYVSEGGYDPASVELFKDQLATQRFIQHKGAELVSTSGEIMRLVVGALARNMSKASAPSEEGDKEY